MSQPIQIMISGGAVQVLERIKDRAGVSAAVRAAMQHVNEAVAIPHIQADYLSYPKDGPTTLAGCRVISNRLRASIFQQREPAGEVDSGIQSSIGSNVAYARIQEEGGTIQREVKPGVARLRATASGKLLRQPGGRGAVFAGHWHRRAKEVPFAGGKQYAIELTGRHFVWRGITDKLADYSAAFARAIIGFWEGSLAS